MTLLIFLVIILLGSTILFAVRASKEQQMKLVYKEELANATQFLQEDADRLKESIEKSRQDNVACAMTKATLDEVCKHPLRYLKIEGSDNIALRLTNKDNTGYKAFTYQGNSDISDKVTLVSPLLRPTK
jgi:hypothetical protein